MMKNLSILLFFFSFAMIAEVRSSRQELLAKFDYFDKLYNISSKVLRRTRDRSMEENEELYNRAYRSLKSDSLGNKFITCEEGQIENGKYVPKQEKRCFYNNHLRQVPACKLTFTPETGIANASCSVMPFAYPMYNECSLMQSAFMILLPKPHFFCFCNTEKCNSGLEKEYEMWTGLSLMWNDMERRIFAGELNQKD